jgi:N-carbamoylputrescine amidase
MRCTVCEFHDHPEELEQDWAALCTHVREQKSEIVLLPEMPFAPWPAVIHSMDPEVWQRFVSAHKSWLERFEELDPATVFCTFPLIEDGVHYNEGFYWEQGVGYWPVHRKYYLPEEEGFWEATWYSRGDKTFQIAQTSKGTAGFLICTELWFTEHARSYARQGIDFLLVPRAGVLASVDKWLAGGRNAAVMSGAFCLSSNRTGYNNGVEFGGLGWIIDPDGNVLGKTSPQQPFVTCEIDLSLAHAAKSTYPRYVLE